MIKNKEIYGEYFSSSRSIAFDQSANSKEFKLLIALFKEWKEKTKEEDVLLDFKQLFI